MDNRPASSAETDFLIVGQGLAGTVLAWQLRRRGQRVFIVDEGRPQTASQIAAGLVTPITGQRLVPSWRFEEFWPAAIAFYRRIEQETGTALFHEVPMVRLFKTEAERRRIEESRSEEIPSLVRFPEPLVEKAIFANPHGGFEMTGGRLDVSAFLNASRSAFAAEGQFQTGTLRLPADLRIEPEGVFVPRWNLKARRVIFCEGFAARDNPWFTGVPFDAAKGEMLTIRVPGLFEQRIIHRGIWLAPLGKELFRAGATYDRDHLDHVPTETGREEICHSLREFLRRPFEVVDQHAAVRPIVLGRHPVIGLHPQFPQLGYFNGLASKGALQAPYIADQFANFLVGNGEIEKILDLQQRFGDRL